MKRLIPSFLRGSGDWVSGLVTCVLMALGVGGVTAVFSAAFAIIWAPLPFPNADRLIVLETEDTSNGSVRGLSFPDYLDLANSSALSGATIAGPVRLTLTDESGAVSSRVGEYVAGEYFDLLGGRALLGRTFTPEEMDARGAAAGTMMISEASWRTRHGANPNVIGRVVTTSAGVFSIVGVFPSAFGGLIGELCLICDPVDFLLPGSAASVVYPGRTENRRQRWHYAVGLLKPDVSFSGARAELVTRATTIANENPATNRGLSVRVSPVGESWRAPLRPLLATLAGGAGLLLLVAVVNAGCLMLVQADCRGRDLAVRVALGADRRDIWWELLGGVLLLSVLATGLGYLIAVVLVRGTVKVTLPGYVDLSVQWPMLLFAGGLTALAAAAGTVAPMIRALRCNVAAQLSSGTKAIIGDGLNRWSKPIIAIEVAIVLVLMVGAGLLIESVRRFENTDPGFDRRELNVFELSPDGPQYRDPEAQLRFIRTLRAGLESSRLGNNFTIAAPHLPPRTFVRLSIQPLGAPLGTADGTLSVETHRVLPGFFGIMGIPLDEGRTFSDDQTTPVEPQVLVSRSLGQRLWPGESPVGKRLALPGVGNGTGAIVGVVRDVRYAGLMGKREADYDLYLSLLQAPIAYMTVAARGSDRASIAAEVTAALRVADPSVPVLARSTVRERFQAQGRDLESGAQLVGLFALVATLLGAGGVFGVMAIWVERRRPEIALRLALGANAATVQLLVVRQAAVPVAIGLAVGALGLIWAAPLWQGQLFSITGYDPRIVIGAMSCVTALCVIVVWPTARRASRTNALSVFRQ